ncbi:MAG: tRNA (adenosine(37)-N6)-threonylcarbamoyltransferase complex ATPase subunit type 1 TsaE [bacterium]|nr:tRNA (adenosine(37)-N6)-threonylcarbamoyltransferase complex ATPase subunit type 1 TsaE [bacterium]
MGRRLRSLSADQTRLMGEKIGKRLRPGDVLALTGVLGAGKTCLAQGIARGLGLREQEVVSPTYTLIHELSGPVRLFHIDLYRIEHEEDLEHIGFYDVFDGASVTLIEWGDRFPGALPDAYLQIDLARQGDNDDIRDVRLLPRGDHYEELAGELEAVMLPSLSQGGSGPPDDS